MTATHFSPTNFREYRLIQERKNGTGLFQEIGSKVEGYDVMSMTSGIVLPVAMKAYIQNRKGSFQPFTRAGEKVSSIFTALRRAA